MVLPIFKVERSSTSICIVTKILANIHVFHSVDCCLTQGFAGHSGLFSPAQGLQFQWTLSLRVVCLSVPPLSLRVFGWHVLYIRFTFHLYPYKNHEGKL